MINPATAWLRCVKCDGLHYAGGVRPRRQTMGEMLEAIRSTGKAHTVCRHCGQVSTLKVTEPRISQPEMRVRVNGRIEEAWG